MFTSKQVVVNCFQSSIFTDDLQLEQPLTP